MIVPLVVCAMAACVADAPIEGALKSSDPSTDFNGCDPGQPGSGDCGSGGGSTTTCATLDCSSDSACQSKCGDRNAYCIVYNNGGRDHGFCASATIGDGFNSCDPGNPHPDSSCGGGGGGTTCNTLNCTSDAQCHSACGTPDVSCVTYTLSPGGPEHGACTNG